MADLLTDLEQLLTKAVQHFWTVRGRQGESAGGNDRGQRSAVTGGKHLDGFLELLEVVLIASGLQRAHIYWQSKTVLPGWFRATKSWDLLVVADGKLVAVIEFKSQVGSVSNNINNRVEESLGNATDFWAAYAEGGFAPSGRPWIGFVLILGDAHDLQNTVAVKEPHFPVFPEFKNASYATRYDSLLTKLVRSRLYDAACFLTSSSDEGLQGVYREPNAELSFRTFLTSLLGRAMAVAQMQPPGPVEPPTVEAGPADETAPADC